MRGKAALVGDSADIGVLAAVDEEGCRRRVPDGLMTFEEGDDEVRFTSEPAGFECR